MSQLGRITGSSTMMVVSWVERTQGRGAVEALLERLRSNRGHTLDPQTLGPRTMVDVQVHLSVLEEVAALTDADDDTLRAIGRDGADRVEEAVPGAKLMLKLASPKRLLKHAPRLWGTYADFGGVEVLACERGRARLRIHGFDTHDHFCRTLEGFFEGLLQRAGATDVQVRETTHDDVDGCVFEGRWS